MFWRSQKREQDLCPNLHHWLLQWAFLLSGIPLQSMSAFLCCGDGTVFHHKRIIPRTRILQHFLPQKCWRSVNISFIVLWCFFVCFFVCAVSWNHYNDVVLTINVHVLKDQCLLCLVLLSSPKTIKAHQHSELTLHRKISYHWSITHTYFLFASLIVKY